METGNFIQWLGTIARHNKTEIKHQVLFVERAGIVLVYPGQLRNKMIDDSYKSVFIQDVMSKLKVVIFLGYFRKKAFNKQMF